MLRQAALEGARMDLGGVGTGLGEGRGAVRRWPRSGQMVGGECGGSWEQTPRMPQESLQPL